MSSPLSNTIFKKTFWDLDDTLFSSYYAQQTKNYQFINKNKPTKNLDSLNKTSNFKLPNLNHNTILGYRSFPDFVDMATNNVHCWEEQTLENHIDINTNNNNKNNPHLVNMNTENLLINGDKNKDQEEPKINNNNNTSDAFGPNTTFSSSSFSLYDLQRPPATNIFEEQSFEEHEEQDVFSQQPRKELYPENTKTQDIIQFDNNHNTEKKKTITVFELNEEITAKIPIDEEGHLTSVGSIKHMEGSCRPCAFANNPKKEGCINGIDCLFCHFKHAKRQKQPRLSKQQRLLRKFIKLNAEQPYNTDKSIQHEYSNSFVYRTNKQSCQNSTEQQIVIENQKSKSLLMPPPRIMNIPEDNITESNNVKHRKKYYYQPSCPLQNIHDYNKSSSFFNSKQHYNNKFVTNKSIQSSYHTSPHISIISSTYPNMMTTTLEYSKQQQQFKNQGTFKENLLYNKKLTKPFLENILFNKDAFQQHPSEIYKNCLGSPIYQQSMLTNIGCSNNNNNNLIFPNTTSVNYPLESLHAISPSLQIHYQHQCFSKNTNPNMTTFIVNNRNNNIYQLQN